MSSVPRRCSTCFARSATEMNKPERALALADRDERLIALLAERVSEHFGEFDDVDEGQSIDLRASGRRFTATAD